MIILAIYKIPVDKFRNRKFKIGKYNFINLEFSK